ncbi:MAG: hypothetical protein ACH346_04670 [Chthoniobacterales bacterium]
MNDLPSISLILGFALVAKHFMALLVPTSFQNFLKKFPRSRFWGVALLLLSTTWAFFLIATTDLGEFSSLRLAILTGILVGGALFGWLVQEFLAVRSLGFILLLLAHPVLEMTFLKSGLLPFLISLLAYAWIIAGLFMIGMPYLLRDLISFISAPHRLRLYQLLCSAGLIYGLVLITEGGMLLLAQG